MIDQGSTPCRSCHSLHQRTFNGEVAIHFSGIEGLRKPIVWAFPKLSVCLDCGFTEFTVPERELRVLVEGRVENGALVFERRSEDLEQAG